MFLVNLPDENKQPTGNNWETFDFQTPGVQGPFEHQGWLVATPKRL